MTPVMLEPAAPRSRVKHSTTEPLRSLKFCLYDKTGLIIKPDTIIINHQLELSGTRVKYLDQEKRAYKHEIWSYWLIIN